MAVSYSDLFADLGEIVVGINYLHGVASKLDTHRDDLITQFTSSGATNFIGQIDQIFDNYLTNINNMIEQLISLAKARLTDDDTVVDQLPIVSTYSFNQVIEELIYDMAANSQNVDLCTVTVTAGTAVITNTDPGELVLTKKLPANTTPGPGLYTVPENLGVDTEFPYPDSLIVQCVSDSQNGGIEGNERFVVSGKLPRNTRPYDLDAGNSGTVSFNCGVADSLINMLQDVTSDVPNGWVVDSGTATTDFGQATNDADFGTQPAFKFLDTGNGAISYDIFSVLEPGAVLCLFMYLKRSVGTLTGDLDIDLTINGSVVINDTITMSGTYDAWTLYSNVFTVPLDIGRSTDTHSLVLTNNLGGTGELHINGGGLSPMNYFAGIGMLMTQGPDPFIANDRFPIAVTNDEAGLLSRFFTKALKYQLPSAGTGTITEPTPITP